MRHSTLILTCVCLAGLAAPAAAHLHPGQGRFVQRDPLGYVDGATLFQYEASNPATYTDAWAFMCAAAEKDCCCVDRVEIVATSIHVYIGGDRCNGHRFRTKIVTSKSKGRQAGGCKFEWWERTNIPKANEPANQWNDMFALDPNSPTFAEWRDKPEPPQDLNITDYPCLDPLGGERTRYLEFAITVLSTPQCQCAHSGLTATAFQELHTNAEGLVIYSQSGFVSPSGPITPGQPDD